MAALAGQKGSRTMMRHRVMLALAALAALAGAMSLAGTGAASAGGTGLPAARLAESSGTWGAASELPGSGALNLGGSAGVGSVSCASAGNCAAGGFYADGPSHYQAFVATERNGRWGRAVEVPGSGALNKGGDARVYSVSCASTGNCAAGGWYADGSSHYQAFVISERNGRWRRAIEMPGSGTLDNGGDAQVYSVSCASAGNCAAGGSYKDRSSHLQAFVVSERNGRWGPAVEVPGSGALNKGGGARVLSVSCPSAGNCAAGGFYEDGSSLLEAFVTSERNGRWGRAIEVPGSGALNKGGSAGILSVSCSSAGNCAAGGNYADKSSRLQALVVSEWNGRWGRAIEVPGSGALNKGGSALVGSVSSASAGSSAVGGWYTDGALHVQVFVVSERNGRWGRAIEVTGSGALNKGGDARVLSVSCASAGNCAAGGWYTDGSSHSQAFVISEHNGRWGRAIEVPGSGALNRGGNAAVSSVSCPSAGTCAAGGSYEDGSLNAQAFVVSEH